MNTEKLHTLASVLSTLAVAVSSANAQLHGMGIVKQCTSPQCVGGGGTTDCTMSVGHGDGHGDTIRILEAFDRVDPFGTNTRVPAAGNLPISAIFGNTNCVVGAFPPCNMGPSGSTLNGLPGAAPAGFVSFRQNTYVIQPGDPNPLPDQANITAQDLCDDPDTSGCSMIQQVVQFTASTDTCVLDDNDASTTDTCDPGGDGCVHTPIICGDGIVNDFPNEECDDGNTLSGDGCSATCQDEFCGDGTVNDAPNEQCDDGNANNNDACSNNCTSGCGNGIVNTSEQCDDGNANNNDACSNNCTSGCGNGIVNTGEQCDDGNANNNDACSNNCTSGCGNGIVNSGEQCDDGNTTSGDGCDAFCQDESIDCNENGIDDAIDIANCPQGDQTCDDCTQNGIPDGCEPPLPTCPNDCSAHGACDCGTCACDGGWIGADCSIVDCNGNGIPDADEPT